MKIEIGTFTPDASSKTLVLDDDTLQIKAIHFQVSKAGTNVNLSTGFSDSIKNRAAYTTDNASKKSGRSTTYSVNHYDSTTLKLAGSIPATGFDTVGEFTMNFDNIDSSYTVDFIAYGE